MYPLLLELFVAIPEPHLRRVGLFVVVDELELQPPVLEERLRVIFQELAHPPVLTVHERHAVHEHLAPVVLDVVVPVDEAALAALLQRLRRPLRVVPVFNVRIHQLAVGARRADALAEAKGFALLGVDDLEVELLLGFAIGLVRRVIGVHPRAAGREELVRVRGVAVVPGHRRQRREEEHEAGQRGAHLFVVFLWGKNLRRLPRTKSSSNRALAMADVETDTQERHLSLDDDATRPDGTDAAETEPAGTADDDDTWVDPQTGEKFNKLSPFEAKVVALTLGDAVKQLRLLQQLKVDPEDQVCEPPTTLTTTTNPPRSESDGVQPFPRR